MAENKIWPYENKKYTNAERVEISFRSNKCEEYKDFIEEIEEYVEDFLGDTFVLIKENFMHKKHTDIVISRKIIGKKVVGYKENYMKILGNGNEIIKTILDDSWALAEVLDKEVSQANGGKGFAYCSGDNFD